MPYSKIPWLKLPVGVYKKLQRWVCYSYYRKVVSCTAERILLQRIDCSVYFASHGRVTFGIPLNLFETQLLHK